jgi:hypothetical protein
MYGPSPEGIREPIVDMWRFVYNIVDWLLCHSPLGGWWETWLILRDPEFSALLRERMAEGYRKTAEEDKAIAEDWHRLVFNESTSTTAIPPMNGESTTTWTQGPHW